MNAADYFPLIRKWAHDRRIIQNGNSLGQFAKLVEECKEIKDDPLDGIGDAMVVAVIIAEMYGINIEEIENKQYSGHDLLHDLGELAEAICKSKPVFIPLGSLHAQLVHLAKDYDVKFEDCMHQAWNEIKDRKGEMMSNGVFVKFADL